MRPITRIVFHYSASPDVSAHTIDGWHRDRNLKKIGYHKVIRKDGTIEQGRQDRERGAHCKVCNKYSIGICVTGSNDMPWYPTAAQYASASELVVMYQNMYPIDNITKHGAVQRTACPGRLDVGRITHEADQLRLRQGGARMMSDEEILTRFKDLWDQITYSRIDRRVLSQQVADIYKKLKQPVPENIDDIIGKLKIVLDKDA